MELLKEAYELLAKYCFIPLGNSSTQNILFLTKEDYSVGRKLKTYYSKLWSKIQEVEENYFELKELDIELRKLKRQLENETDELERELIELKIKKVENRKKYIYKLYIDYLKEVEDLIYAIKELPEVTLEEFEKGELENFEKKLLSQMVENSEVASLRALGIEINERGEVIIVNTKPRELVEKRIKSFTIAKDYEQVKQLFVKNQLETEEQSRSTQSLKKQLKNESEKKEEVNTQSSSELETSKVENLPPLKDIVVKARRKEKSSTE